MNRPRRFSHAILASLWLCLAATPLRAELININADELAALLDADEHVTLIDVRTQAEWEETGIVAGSELMTFFDEKGRYDAKAWLQQLAELATREDPVILICRTGSRTGSISRFLDKQVGYDRVYNVLGGVTAWQRSGRELVALERQTESEAPAATGD